MIDFLEFFLKLLKEDKFIVLLLLLLFFSFLAVWAYGLRANQKQVKEVLNFNATKGAELGFLYSIEYGWLGTRIMPVPFVYRKDSEDKG